jgi:hypothetical protein
MAPAVSRRQLHPSGLAERVPVHRTHPSLPRPFAPAIIKETLDLMRTTGRPWPEDAAPLAGCAGQLRKAGRLVVERPDSLAQTEGGLPWDTAERRDALRRQAAEKIHPDDW